MKRFRKLIVVLFVALGISLLPSCVNDADIPSAQTEPIPAPVPVAIDFENVLAFKALLDDSCIYLSTSDSPAEYYRAFFDGTVTKLGEVPNFLLSMKHAVVVDDMVYLFASVYDETAGDYANDLIAIDTKDNTLRQYAHYDGSAPGIPIYRTEGSLLTFKSKRTSDSLITYTESYDLKTGTWETLDTKTLDLASYTGTAIFGLCADMDRICVLYDRRSGLYGPIETHIDVYDGTGTQEYSLLVDADIHDYVMTASISDMQIIGDYIYLYNGSNYGLLAKITPDGLVEVVKDRNLEICRSSTQTDDIILYVRRSDVIYRLNVDSGAFEQVQLKLGAGGTIQTMFSCGETVFLTCYGENTKYAYVVDAAQLDTSIFPCS